MSTTTLAVRPLGPEDAAGFREVRLRALRDAPESFLSSFEDEASFSLEVFADRVRPTDDAVVLGAFVQGALVGIIRLAREARPKVRHKATIQSFFVIPEARGSGVGRALLEEAVRLARAMAGVAQLGLSVSTAAPDAQRLYRTAGFVTWGVEPDAMRVGNASLAEEHMALVFGKS